MEDLKERVEATAEEVKESVKDGTTSFLDDIAMNKHNIDELSDERKAEKEEKKAAKKEKFEKALAAVLDSFKQGVEEFKSDASFTKETVDELSEEHKAERHAKKAARKEKFESSVADLKDSVDTTAEAHREEGAALLDKMKNAAQEAGIDVSENEAIANMFKAVRESFAEGIEEFKSDAAFTKESIEEVRDEHKAEKAAKKEEKKKEFNEKVETVKESFEQGAEALKSDAEFTKAAVDELSEEHKADKAAKEAAKREAFDENIEALKDKINS